MTQPPSNAHLPFVEGATAQARLGANAADRRRNRSERAALLEPAPAVPAESGLAPRLLPSAFGGAAILAAHLLLSPSGAGTPMTLVVALVASLGHLAHRHSLEAMTQRTGAHTPALAWPVSLAAACGGLAGWMLATPFGPGLALTVAQAAAPLCTATASGLVAALQVSWARAVMLERRLRDEAASRGRALDAEHALLLEEAGPLESRARAAAVTGPWARFLAVGLVSLASAGLGGCQPVLPPSAAPSVSALVVTGDLSGTSTAGSGTFCADSVERAGRLRATSQAAFVDFMILQVGDRTTANEPVVLLGWTRLEKAPPFAGPEQASELLAARLTEARARCAEVAHATRHSPIHRAAARAVDALRTHCAEAAGEGASCEDLHLRLSSDFRETELLPLRDRIARMAAGARPDQAPRVERLDVAGITVEACGVAETRGGFEGGPSLAGASAETLAAAWAPVFGLSRLLIAPSCR